MDNERKKDQLSAYREEFPITKRFVYLDHAGVAPISRRVESALMRFIGEALEEAMFKYGVWMSRVDEIRKKCAMLIASEPEEIAFVKNTSHGLSIVAEGIEWRRGDNLILYEKEFPSNIYPWINLRRKGVELRFVPSRNGRIHIEDIKRLMDSRTRLVTISSVQFSNGFRINLGELGELCKRRNVLFCVDAIQSLGVIPMNVKEFQIDFLSADGHKWLLAPEGTGIFYCRKGLEEKLNPPLIGWKSVKKEFDYDSIDFDLKTDALRFEEGSLNLLGIFALGAAVDLLLEVGIDAVEKKVLELGDLIIEEAERRGFLVNTPKSRDERAGIVSLSGEFDPVWVKDNLREMGIMVNVRGGALRVSPHFYNTYEEIEFFFKSLERLVRYS
ncbi:MAG: cysteine desulfurase [Deltaproteobacteria bacterium]|jgi:cysteine desulfurase/selenocysteine lyase|nr:MAG: cysteine desulfurase [Deltaproteobacteria bacterium]